MKNKRKTNLKNMQVLELEPCGRSGYHQEQISYAKIFFSGQKFAILEMKSALCGILRNFNLEPVDKPEDIIFKIDMVLRPKGEIRVKFVPRANSC